MIKNSLLDHSCLIVKNTWQLQLYAWSKSAKHTKKLISETELPHTKTSTSKQKKLPVSVQALVWIPVNPLIESQWSILFTAPGLQTLNMGRSAHVSLLNESLPFPAALSLSPLFLSFTAPPLTHSLTLDFHWPAAILNYHGKRSR